MEADLIINQRITIPGAELTVTVSRASGPGGQHVNKTSSRVSLRFNVAHSVAFSDEQRARVMERLRHRIVGDGELLIHVETERSQLQNRRIARERLAELLVAALRVQKSRVATKPSKRAKARRLEGKSLRGIVKKLRGRVGGDEK